MYESVFQSKHMIMLHNFSTGLPRWLWCNRATTNYAVHKCCPTSVILIRHYAGKNR
jgi:hypothetical protein